MADQHSYEESIAAAITPPGRGAVAVVRVSGRKVKDAIDALTPRAEQILAGPREAIYAPLRDSSGATFDHAVFSYFPGPRSYTGEDCLEVAVHGSPFIIRKLLATLSELGIRMARAGEFSERAFLNGKMDLSQAEAVCDLIAAETEVQARVAREQLEGKLSQALSDLGEPLRELLAEVEAHIDFPDEDIEPLTQEGWLRELRKMLDRVNGYCDSFQHGRLCREGALVVLAGLPNAGKSSLLNRLLGEDRAIVTPIPGTTRDSIEELASIGGYAVRLCDTAGLLEDSDQRALDPVEALGIERSWRKLEQAELVLFVVDAGLPFEQQFQPGGVFEKVRARARSVLVVGNKVELSDPAGLLPRFEPLLPKEGCRICFTSALSGEGISGLGDTLAEMVFQQESARSSVLLCNERHYRALLECGKELREATTVIGAGQPPEIVAFHIRTALTFLSDIVGVTYTDDILGRIFSKFCIGK